MKNEDTVKFAESIPIEELFQEIRRVTGLSDLKFRTTIIPEDRRQLTTIKFESEDLVELLPDFLKLLFSYIEISSFSSAIDYDKERDMYFWWGSVGFNYDHTSGGSNGKTFYRFSYTNTRGWEFNPMY